MSWVEYIDSLSWSKRRLDEAIWCAFLRGASLKVDPAQVNQEVAVRIGAAGDSVREHKLQQQLRRAYEYISAHLDGLNGTQLPKRPKLEYRPEQLAALASKIQLDDIADYLRVRSKFTPWNRSPAAFLHKLYRAGERVLVLSNFHSQGQDLWEHPGLVGDQSTLDHLASGQANVWFLCNPVDGEFHWNPRQRTNSRRSEEAVMSFRYAVLESDQAPRDLWLRALVRLPLPIASITDSGGSSLHTLIRIDADSKAEWDEVVRGRLAGPLTVLGADPQALTALRLTRFANCRRGETGKMQDLLYLDNEPVDIPICEITPRDPDTLRSAFLKSYGAQQQKI